MTQPLRLHYAPDNASLCVRLALCETGTPFETVLVDRAAGGQRTPEYLALNPNGLIPTLEAPGGPIFETAAILLWLADRSGGLMAAPDAAGRGSDLAWLFWLSNTLHPALRMVFYPDKYLASDPAAIRAATRVLIGAHLDVLSSGKHTDWLGRDGPSIHACYLAPMLRWLALYGGEPDWFDLSRWPRLLDFAQRFEKRPAALTCARAEGLGPTPFSAPSAPCPPEGSVL